MRSLRHSQRRVRGRNLSAPNANGLHAGRVLLARIRMRKRWRTRRNLLDIVPVRPNRSSAVRDQLPASPAHVRARRALLTGDGLRHSDALPWPLSRPISWPLPRQCMLHFLQLRRHRTLSVPAQLPAAVQRSGAGPLPAMQ